MNTDEPTSKDNSEENNNSEEDNRPTGKYESRRTVKATPQRNSQATRRRKR